MKLPLNPKITFGLMLAGIFSCQPPQKITSEVDLPDNTTSTYVEKEPDPIYAEHVRTSKFQTPEEEMADFVLPPGFEVTLFASEPDITKPINMAFDEKGRLWVSQSSEYPIKAGPGDGKDRISILEDTNGDGKADQITEFANDLNIPIGIQPVKGGAIAFSIPNLYRFYDTNADGVADKKEVLLGPFETKDTHGMVNNLFRGLDGWIHASHGFSNISVVSGTDGDSIKMVSGNTFRVKMDGSRVEKTSDGRINPFGSDLDALGYHYSADCHTLPIYQLIGGGNYTQWGKKEPNMGFAPSMMDYGLNSTALSGLVYYTDNQFPQAYQNSFYSGDVVTCRISRSTMTFNGSSPNAIRQADFLVSKDPWFRPVDIKIGPDGAMYVADFYNPIIGHYEVPLDHPDRDRVSGRIWKITYQGMEKTITDWSKSSMPKLIDALNDPVLHTRMVATDELVDRYGRASLPSLNKLVNLRNTDPKQLVQGLWALHRLNELDNTLLEKALYHKDRLVRVHAHRILTEWEELGLEEQKWVIQGLKDSDAHVRRVSAETLIRHPGENTFKPIMTSLEASPKQDTHLNYALKLALYQHAQVPEITKKMAEEAWNENEKHIMALIFSDTQHEIAGVFLLDYLKNYQVPGNLQLPYLTALARNLPIAQLSDGIEFAKINGTNSPHLKIQALSQGLDQRGISPPASLINWNLSLVNSIFNQMSEKSNNWTEEELEQIKFAASASADFKLEDQIPALQQLINRPYLEEEVRVLAANALMDIDPAEQAVYLKPLIGKAEYSISFRQKIATAIGRSQNDPARKVLKEGMKNAPLELQETIASLFAKEKSGKTLIIQMIREGIAPARILKSRIVEENFLADADTSQLQAFEELTANLIPISEERQSLIDNRLENYNENGISVLAGKTLYEQHCSMCHQVNNEGGLIGPQLDGIGNWGLHALATKVLDPNRNISENFRTYTISLKNGQTRSGLFRREEGQVIILADQSGNEFSIPKNDIVKQTASTITLMPDYFSTNLGQDDFNELMHYLLSLK